VCADADALVFKRKKWVVFLGGVVPPKPIFFRGGYQVGAFFPSVSL